MDRDRINENRRKIRWKYKEKELEYQRKSRRQRIKWFIDLKNLPCEDCQKRYPVECMEWDHCKGKKLFCISGGAAKSWVQIIDELFKCDLVCANCHRLRTHQRGQYTNGRSK